MVEFNTLASQDPLMGQSFGPAQDAALAGFTPQAPGAPQYTDEQLLEVFDRYKREAMESRWIWEREWMRDLYYIANRQWITYHPTRREWMDKRLASWMPKPVTNKIAEILQSIRTNFAAVNLAIKARPLGSDAEAVAAAEVTEQMSPLIHEEHEMNQVMREADFWFIATGNALLQLTWERDKRFNKVFIPSEMCVGCQKTFTPKQILDANNACPNCGSVQFIPAVDAQGQPVGNSYAYGRGKTMALSPFEYAFPPNVTRWDELPYLIRLRWRDKHWFEANKPELVNKITWQKAPTDRSLQIYKSLATTNDLAIGGHLGYLGASGADTVEGVTEYEIWVKPNTQFPEGYVFRVLGDNGPIVLHLEQEEAIPGPLPYKDIEGNPLWPFVHAQYEHMGGRLYGRSAVSPLIQKQDQVNQLDANVQLSFMRMSNPVWIIPEGAGIDHLTGQPGQMVKWNPLLSGGQGKPERVSGAELPSGAFELRAQYLKDMEELSGAFDIIKGQKPSGVEAFSALQLLVERSQSRFTSAFQSRGEMYRRWFSVAIELERQFGPEQRTQSVVSNNKGYTFRHFENAKLQGQVTITIEDGSNVPKTSLGKRAAIEQASQLGLLDAQDPEQRYLLLSTFGLSELVPSLNFHINTSATIQDQFERWAANPVGPMPLVVKPWYDPRIHYAERIKWLNTDKMRELLAANPALEPLVSQHIMDLQMLAAPPPVDPKTGAPLAAAGPVPPGVQPPVPQGGGMAMTNSNRESGGTDAGPNPQVGV